MPWRFPYLYWLCLFLFDRNVAFNNANSSTCKPGGIQCYRSLPCEAENKIVWWFTSWCTSESWLVSAQADNWVAFSILAWPVCRWKWFFSKCQGGYVASTSWHRALQIPDSAVTLDDKGHLFAKVAASQKDSSITHLVWNPGSDFAFCAVHGQCKEIFASMSSRSIWYVKNDEGYKPSMSFQAFREILMDLWKKPMDDSIALDESVAWTHQMLDQIKQLVELNSSNDIGIVVNNMPLKWVSKKGRTFVGIPASLPALPSSSKSIAKNLQKKNRKRKRLARLR